ncbi:hypothetical protein OIDMADRAFT_208750 [Oidiodendron maius Zn]|uniref:Zn(2)-C6 fungal-type domain-containing protein n=1 Tax=Oidiodendron maius (strain Zn) TaxID=913774 RepID=A0A0C3CSK5_OIDMZ|nr:hypothetical protein OIDMADRAFT_208750 [Oidiodendron maius Zn]
MATRLLHQPSRKVPSYVQDVRVGCNCAGPMTIYKRSHLKSRNGCIQCKRRKVKCDESPNSCGPCIKRRIRCSFQPVTSPSSPQPQTTSPHPVSSLLDLELLHNFSTETSLTITTHVPLQQFYRTTFVTEALKTDYLLQYVLSISAFHLAQQHQELLVSVDENQKSTILLKIEGYLVAANFYHDVALSSFRQSLANITAEDSHALFACAALIAMTSLAQSTDSLRTLSLTANQESGSTIMKWLVLIRGVNSVLRETREWVCVGPMAPMLYMRDTEGYGSSIGKVGDDVTAHLDRLSAAFLDSAEPRVADVCVGAIELLRQSFAGIAAGCDYSIVFFWPVLVHEDYMALLQSNRPEALVVLGSYCVLLHTQNWCWWIKGWPAHMLKTIDEVIGEQWRTWLAWPWETISNMASGQRKNRVLLVSEGLCCQ